MQSVGHCGHGVLTEVACHASRCILDHRSRERFTDGHRAREWHVAVTRHHADAGDSEGNSRVAGVGDYALRAGYPSGRGDQALPGRMPTRPGIFFELREPVASRIFCFVAVVW
jgi:hypothetical protein